MGELASGWGAALAGVVVWKRCLYASKIPHIYSKIRLANGGGAWIHSATLTGCGAVW